MYEITGFRAESDNYAYWQNYADFEELGETNLVREDKNERLIAYGRYNPRKASAAV